MPPRFSATGETPVTIAEIELMLAHGQIFAEMRNGRFWQVRRNGATRRWKREPERFAIPVKAGLRSYATITERNIGEFVIRK